MIFKNISSLSLRYPLLLDSIERENKKQFPHAKFMIAGETEDECLHVFYDVGVVGQVLWVSCGAINDEEGYIDEYYEVSLQEAEQYSGGIFNA